MSEVSKYPPGTFCWIDLASNDPEGSEKFYRELFGWDLHNIAVEEDMAYSLFLLNGKSVAGMHPMGPMQRAQGAPPNWCSYVAVESADATVSAAEALGATIFFGPNDAMDAGRMAVIQDTTGAVFAIWEPKNHTGSAYANQPGSFAWNELATTDSAVAGKFYSSLFGWTSETKDMGHMLYTSFMNNGRPAGGMMEIQKEWGPVPPNWLVYFAVADADHSLAKAVERGATALMEPVSIPGVGRFVALKDPQGAAFAVIKLDQEPSPL